MAIAIIDNRAVEVDDFDTGPLYAVNELVDHYETLVGNGDPVTVVSTLADAVNSCYYDIGCILFNLKRTEAYRKYGHEYDKDNHAGWKAFCNDILVGINYRTAQYWLNIYRYYDGMGFDKDRVIAMGWSKAKELVDFTELPDKLEAAVSFAEEHSIADVKGYVELNTPDVNGEVGNAPIKVEPFRFYLAEEPAVHIKQILEDATRYTDGDLNSAFFKICIEWQMANAVTEPSTLNIGD